MIGFPDETDADIEGIIDLCREINTIGKKILKGRFKLHVSINTLIPKAHTPYQWATLARKETVEAKYQILKDGLKSLKIKVNYPDYNLIQLEALLSRGDRKISDVIFTAWKNGAKFDAWREGFSADIWQNSIRENKISLESYLYEKRDINQQLPWDFVNTGVDKSFLKKEFLKSREGKTTPGCFQKCSACGIMQNLQIDCSKARIGDI